MLAEVSNTAHKEVEKERERETIRQQPLRLSMHTLLSSPSVEFYSPCT